MAQSDEKIAKEIVIAWLSNHEVKAISAEATGEYIGIVYNVVLAAVKRGSLKPVSVSPEVEVPPSRGRRPRP